MRFFLSVVPRKSLPGRQSARVHFKFVVVFLCLMSGRFRRRSPRVAPRWVFPIKLWLVTLFDFFVLPFVFDFLLPICNCSQFASLWNCFGSVFFLGCLPLLRFCSLFELVASLICARATSRLLNVLKSRLLRSFSYIVCGVSLMITPFRLLYALSKLVTVAFSLTRVPKSWSAGKSLISGSNVLFVSEIFEAFVLKAVLVQKVEQFGTKPKTETVLGIDHADIVMLKF